MVTFEDFNKFATLILSLFDTCYKWLNSISIAGLTMFQWMLGFIAAGAIFSIIRSFAGVGSVSVTGVASGGAEQIRVAQAEGQRKAEQRTREAERAAERAAEHAKRESYAYYKENRSRSESYSARYQKEKGGK